jgi:hypothetical protein
MAGDCYEICHYRNLLKNITEQVKKLLPYSLQIMLSPQIHSEL